MNDQLVVAFTAPLMFVLVLWVIFSTIRRLKVAQLQAGVQTKMLETFGSSQDLLGYMQSEAGRRFVQSLSVEQATPYSRILSALQAGIVFTAVGAGLLLIRNHVSGADQGFLVLGTIVLALGIGFALSAFASYTLSKSFGLLTNLDSNS